MSDSTGVINHSDSQAVSESFSNRYIDNPNITDLSQQQYSGVGEGSVGSELGQTASYTSIATDSLGEAFPINSTVKKIPVLGDLIQLSDAYQTGDLHGATSKFIGLSSGKAITAALGGIATTIPIPQVKVIAGIGAIVAGEIVDSVVTEASFKTEFSDINPNLKNGWEYAPSIEQWVPEGTVKSTVINASGELVQQYLPGQFVASAEQRIDLGLDDHRELYSNHTFSRDESGTIFVESSDSLTAIFPDNTISHRTETGVIYTSPDGKTNAVYQQEGQWFSSKLNENFNLVGEARPITDSAASIILDGGRPGAVGSMTELPNGTVIESDYLLTVSSSATNQYIVADKSTGEISLSLGTPELSKTIDIKVNQSGNWQVSEQNGGTLLTNGETTIFQTGSQVVVTGKEQGDYQLFSIDSEGLISKVVRENGVITSPVAPVAPSSVNFEVDGQSYAYSDSFVQFNVGGEGRVAFESEGKF